ncbi:hypothetical protein Drorol1_Dr00004776 [Drosera rotundifolia]
MEENPTITISQATHQSPYHLLFQALLSIPISHYWIGLATLLIIFLYNLFECHFIWDFITGIRGQSVSLTFDSFSLSSKEIVSNCPSLNKRYLVTPWLASPHLQTLFLTFVDKGPAFNYKRKIFHASDGGTIALDCLFSLDVHGDGFNMNNDMPKNDIKSPIMVVIPGLTSDSASSYIKHLAYNSAKDKWNVVVVNHRGLGGVSVTTDWFYNAGWTEDVREVVRYLRNEYHDIPIFLVGTSIGANVLVKYLGEEGNDTLISGAVAICNPWDLLINDRFISRRVVQKIYDRAIAGGLQGYAQLHQTRMARLANWDGIKKSRRVRDFDNHATCIIAKYETVDTYYRQNTSTNYLRNVSVPLLCINALDDPICTREAIPWDECRLNKNVILATTKHGGHLAFYEGITASRLWWVRAVNEFLHYLPHRRFHFQLKTQVHGLCSPFKSTMDQGPFVNVAEDGTVAAAGNELARDNGAGKSSESPETAHKHASPVTEEDQHSQIITEERPNDSNQIPSVVQRKEIGEHGTDSYAVVSHIRRHVDQLSRQTRRSMWLLVYIAVVTTWPLAGSALLFFLRKSKKISSSTVLKR